MNKKSDGVVTFVETDRQFDHIFKTGEEYPMDKIKSGSYVIQDFDTTLEFIGSIVNGLVYDHDLLIDKCTDDKLVIRFHVIPPIVLMEGLKNKYIEVTIDATNTIKEARSAVLDSISRLKEALI